jgi:hypothetical protein
MVKTITSLQWCQAKDAYSNKLCLKYGPPMVICIIAGQSKLGLWFPVAFLMLALMAVILGFGGLTGSGNSRSA